MCNKIKVIEAQWKSWDGPEKLKKSESNFNSVRSREINLKTDLDELMARLAVVAVERKKATAELEYFQRQNASRIGSIADIKYKTEKAIEKMGFEMENIFKRSNLIVKKRRRDLVINFIKKSDSLSCDVEELGATPGGDSDKYVRFIIIRGQWRNNHCGKARITSEGRLNGNKVWIHRTSFIRAKAADNYPCGHEICKMALNIFDRPLTGRLIIDSEDRRKAVEVVYPNGKKIQWKYQCKACGLGFN